MQRPGHCRRDSVRLNQIRAPLRPDHAEVVALQHRTGLSSNLATFQFHGLEHLQFAVTEENKRVRKTMHMKVEAVTPSWWHAEIPQATTLVLEHQHGPNLRGPLCPRQQLLDMLDSTFWLHQQLEDKPFSCADPR
eukprot:3855010-Rhodomonas_salina.2